MTPHLPAPFGEVWDRLSLEHLQAFLAVKEDESLTWEAKGHDIRREHVRQAASAFGNSVLTKLLT